MMDSLFFLSFSIIRYFFFFYFLFFFIHFSRHTEIFNIPVSSSEVLFNFLRYFEMLDHLNLEGKGSSD